MDKPIIDKIIEMTKQLAPIPEIAFRLDMTEGQLRAIIDDPGRPEYMMFRKAVAETIAAIRQKDLELYYAGSPTAATAVAAYMKTMLTSL